MTNLLVHYVQHVCYSLPLRFWTTSQNHYQDRQACLHLNIPLKNCYIRSECTTVRFLTVAINGYLGGI